MPQRHHKAGKKPAVDQLSGTARPSGGDTIAWEAPEFMYYKKGWVWVAFLLALAFAFMAIFYTMNDYSAMAVVALAAVVLYQQAQARPKTLKYRVDEDGFQIGEERFGWNDLRSFWITVGDHDRAHLYLESTTQWLPVKTVHLANVDPEDLRTRLAAHLPEHVTRGEAFADLLIRWLKL